MCVASVAMPVKKLSIALHPDIAAQIARSAAQHDTSVSGWIEDAARAALRREAGLAACDEYERDFGALTPEEIAWADTILDRDFGPAATP